MKATQTTSNGTKAVHAPSNYGLAHVLVSCRANLPAVDAMVLVGTGPAQIIEKNW